MNARREDAVERELDRLQEAIPADLRGDWAVVPRRLLLKVFLAGCLLGAAAALTAAGYALGAEPLQWAWPAVLVGLVLAARFLPWWRDDRAEEQLRRRSDRVR